MKKLIDALWTSDLQVVCPGCCAAILVSAADVRASAARSRVGLPPTDVAARALAGPGHDS